MFKDVDSVLKNLLAILMIGLAFSNADGQDFPTYLKKYAVKIDKLDSLNNNIYDLISDYKLIMIGEMHGTNEPAKFVIGLTELMTNKGDSVQVGFEISTDQMTEFLHNHSDKSISSSDFFSKNSLDGRASFAWAEAISRLNKNPNVNIFFYDVNDGESKTFDDRDSIMCLKIKNKIKEHPSWKTVTLSGNIHNMLLPYKGKTKMALYLSNDKELNISAKICSLNHYYQSGTMLNNTGNGLEMHQIDNQDWDYAKLVDYDNYLFLFPINMTDSYSGIYFTRKVTAAKLVNGK